MNFKAQRAGDLCMYRLSSIYEGRYDVAMTLKEHKENFHKASLRMVLSRELEDELSVDGKEFSRRDVMWRDGFDETPLHFENGRTANPAKINLKIDFPVRCDWCKGTFAFEDPPTCECGEFFCSQECQEQDRKHGNHDNSCKLVLEAQTRGGATGMTNRYWHFVLTGRLPWKYAAVPKYSLKYEADKKLSDPKNKGTYMDEFQFLMQEERNAVVELAGKLQDPARDMKKSETERREAMAIFGSEMILQYYRLSSYLPHYDTHHRMQFKLFMVSVIERILNSVDMGGMIPESSGAVAKKFSKTLNKFPPAVLPSNTTLKATALCKSPDVNTVF